MTEKDFTELKNRIEAVRPKLRGISSHEEVLENRMINRFLTILEEYYQEQKSEEKPFYRFIN